MSDSLRNKTVSGLGWSAADALLGQGVSFVVGIVLARLLSPSEYGLIGIVLIFTTVLTGIVDSGFSNALIRKKDASNADFNTMFITNMVASVALYILLWFCASPIADFFSREELVDLTRVTGLILILQALSITQVTLLTKRLDFKTKTKASVISAIVSGIIGIIMALTGLGVWALVAQQLSRMLIYTISLWLLNKWCPNFSFSIQSFRYMWGFGWKLMVSGLLNNVWKQLYQVVVGKCYTPETLGQYSRSREYAQLFSQNFTSIIQRVTYPVLSEVQDDKVRMVAVYRKIIKTTMFVTALCMFFLGAIAEPFIHCLIGPKWHEAACFLPYICISMSFYPLHAINLNLLQVQGRSGLFLKLEIIKKILAIGPLCLGVFLNIYWMLVGSIAVGLCDYFLNSHYSGRELGYSSMKQLKDVAPSYLVSFVIAVAVYFLKFLPISYWIILPLQVMVGISLLILIGEKTQLQEYKEVKAIAAQYIEMFKNRILVWIK